jgi:hypothetical protein
MLNDKVYTIALNGRFIYEKIYDQDYPLIRKPRINFEGDDITQNKFTNKEVKYYSKYNSNGFRCDEFKKDHTKKHILFAGCSETVGEGSIIEDSWSHMLYDKIDKDLKCSGFFSLGIGGGNWMDILSLINQYIESCGNPDYLFINFPGINRLAQYIDVKDTDKIDVSGVYRYSLSLKDSDNLNGVNVIGETDFYLSELAYLPFSLYIRLFEKFCLQNNIKLFWGSWCQDLKEKIDRKLVVYNNYVEIHPTNKDLAEICLSNKMLNLEKTDGHFGTAYHYKWSENFYKKMRNV